MVQCKQNGPSVTAYYRHLKKIWDELLTYVKAQGCTSDKCTCNWAADLSQEKEESCVHQFFHGLDDDLYGTLHFNLIAQDPLPPLNRTYRLMF